MANFATTLLETILNAFISFFFLAATEYIFTEYNSYFGYLFGQAGNLQVSAKF